MAFVFYDRFIGASLLIAHRFDPAFDISHLRGSGLFSRQHGLIAAIEVRTFHRAQIRLDDDIGILQLVAIDAVPHDRKRLQ